MLRNVNAIPLQLNLSPALCEKCNIELLLIMGVSHPRNLGNQSGHVRWTTGGAKPRSPASRAMIERVLSIRFERVDVEEAISLKIDRSKHVVQQCDLRHIQIPGVLVQQEHAVVEQHVAYRRAGLIESVRVRQLILGPKAFNAMNRAKPPGDVHSRIRDIPPDFCQCLCIARVARQRADIRHSRIEISRPHRVTDRLFLLRHRCVLLGVGWSHDPLALRDIRHTPDFKEPASHIQIQRLAGNPVELHQSKFHFLMPRGLLDRLALVVVRIPLKNDPVDMLRAFLRNIQQFRFAGGLIVGDRRLVEVPNVV